MITFTQLLAYPPFCFYCSPLGPLGIRLLLLNIRTPLPFSPTAILPLKILTAVTCNMFRVLSSSTLIIRWIRGIKR